MTLENSETPAIRESSVRFVGEVGPLFEALAKAQGEFATIVKDSTAEVQAREGKRGYTFDYAGIDVVLAAVRPALTKNGLAVCQVFSGLGSDLTTILAHGAARIEVTCGLPDWTGAQGLGSVITYMKRYQLLGLLAVAPSDDDDGNAASGNQATITPRTRPTPPVVKPADPAKSSDLTPATKDAIKGLSAAIGFKNSELEKFSVDHGCGQLADLSQAKGEALVKMLEAQKVQP
jgi:hypothetical protein